MSLWKITLLKYNQTIVSHYPKQTCNNLYFNSYLIHYFQTQKVPQPSFKFEGIIIHLALVYKYPSLKLATS